jgi:hypothetical protein
LPKKSKVAKMPDCDLIANPIADDAVGCWTSTDDDSTKYKNLNNFFFLQFFYFTLSRFWKSFVVLLQCLFTGICQFNESAKPLGSLGLA